MCIRPDRAPDCLDKILSVFFLVFVADFFYIRFHSSQQTVRYCLTCSCRHFKRQLNVIKFEIREKGHFYDTSLQRTNRNEHQGYRNHGRHQRVINTKAQHRRIELVALKVDERLRFTQEPCFLTRISTQCPGMRYMTGKNENPLDKRNQESGNYDKPDIPEPLPERAFKKQKKREEHNGCQYGRHNRRKHIHGPLHRRI